MNKKKVDMLLLVSCAFFAILAIVLFVFGIVYNKGALAKILLFIASVLVLLLAAEIAYLFVLSRNVKPNYFLFNPVLNMNMPVSKLSFEIIDEKMNKYLSNFAPSEGKLWTEGILENKASAIKNEFRPLVAYKLLFDMADNDTEAAWKCFVLATDMTVEYLATGLAENGDGEMASAIRQLKNAKPINMKQTRSFLVGNKKYIKKKLTKYVVDNINKF